MKYDKGGDWFRGGSGNRIEQIGGISALILALWVYILRALEDMATVSPTCM